MSPATAFVIATMAADWMPVFIPLAIMLVGRPRNFAIRCFVAVLAGWAFLAFFVPLVYNPAGISAGHASGEHFPEARYDKSLALFFGWLVPAATTCLSAVLRWAWRNFQRQRA